jgi:AcrR family transcriptional regulator
MGNKDETKERILAAGLHILSEDGFAALGVNNLARRSGADKQLIYRYFGGLDGVLSALGLTVALRLAEALDAAAAPMPETYGQLAERLVLALWRHLRGDQMYRQLRLMEVAAPSAVTAAFAQARGQALAQWVGARAEGLARPKGVDVAALNAVLIAAVEGLAILGAVGLDSESDARTEAALRALVAAAYR